MTAHRHHLRSVKFTANREHRKNSGKPLTALLDIYARKAGYRSFDHLQRCAKNELTKLEKALSEFQEKIVQYAQRKYIVKTNPVQLHLNKSKYQRPNVLLFSKGKLQLSIFLVDSSYSDELAPRCPCTPNLTVNQAPYLSFTLAHKGTFESEIENVLRPRELWWIESSKAKSEHSIFISLSYDRAISVLFEKGTGFYQRINRALACNYRSSDLKTANIFIDTNALSTIVWGVKNRLASNHFRHGFSVE